MSVENNFHQAFLETKYVILPNQYHKEAIKIIIGKELTELDVYPDFKSFGFLTAWNPLPNILTDEENILRNQELKVDIENLGYYVYDGFGVSKDELWQEASFFILNIDLEILKVLSKKYGQLAFVYGQKYSLSGLIYKD
jgi:hypothetical protein